MIFGKDLGRSAFFAEIGSEVERLDSIPSNYTNLVCIGQGVRLTDTVGRDYRIDLFISPTGCIAVRLPLPLAGASPTDADPKHLRRVASIVRAWSMEQLNEVCADHFYRAEGQAADIIDVLVRAGLAGFSDKGNVSKALAATLADGELLFEVIDSASAHKVFTSRELIDRFSAAKGVDPDDVTEFIGALEVMDGFSAVSIGREIIVQYAPLVPALQVHHRAASLGRGGRAPCHPTPAPEQRARSCRGRQFLRGPHSLCGHSLNAACTRRLHQCLASQH